MDFVTSAQGAQRFRYHDAGTGPAVVLLHGFPDGPESWAATSELLVDAGYRVITPFLRGYHSDTRVPGRAYGRDEIGGDVIGLLDALELDRAVIAGHDWGSSAAWSALRLASERIDGIVAIAVPHPASLKPSLSLMWQTRHFAYFKLPFSDQRTARNDLAYIERLYDRWAPKWTAEERRSTVARAKEILGDDDVLHEALEWYRDLSLKPDPANEFRVGCPGLLVTGAEDFPGVNEAFERTTAWFDAPAELLTIPNAGHWPHREGQQQFHDGLLAFLTSLS